MEMSVNEIRPRADGAVMQSMGCDAIRPRAERYARRVCGNQSERYSMGVMIAESHVVSLKVITLRSGLT